MGYTLPVNLVVSNSHSMIIGSSSLSNSTSSSTSTGSSSSSPSSSSLTSSASSSASHSSADYHQHMDTHHLAPQYIVDSIHNTNGTVSLRLPLGYTIVEIAVAILAFFGNLLAIIVFIQDRRLRKVTNFYIVSLSLADLLVGLVGVPSAISTRIGLPRDAFTGCLTMLSLLVVLCTISILNLVAVSLDRLWAILYPLNYHSRMSSSAARIIIITCWIIGALVGFLPLFGWNNGPNRSHECFFLSIMDYDFLVFLFFATIVFPALIMFFAYLRIYLVVIRTSTLFDKNGSKRSGNNLIKQNNNNNNYPQNCGSTSSSLSGKLYHHYHHHANQNYHRQYLNNQSASSSSSSPPQSTSTTTTTITNDSIKTTIKSSSCRSCENCLIMMRLSSKCSDKSSPQSTINGSIESYDQRRLTSTSYHRREVKKARKLAIIVIFFMLCWIPLYLNNTLEAFFSLRQPDWLVDTFIVLSHLNSAVNPLLYAYHMKDFRESMKLLLCRCIFKPTGLRDHHRRQELITVSGKQSASQLQQYNNQLTHNQQQASSQVKQSTDYHQTTNASTSKQFDQRQQLTGHNLWTQSTNTPNTSPEHEMINNLNSINNIEINSDRY